MKLFLRYTFIFSAWLFMFGHSVVPHMHHNEQESHFTHELTNEEMGILDYLGQMFHFSTGERHLEDFRTNNLISVAFLLPNTLELPTLIAFETSIFHFIPHFPLRDIAISAISLRGPPAIS